MKPTIVVLAMVFVLALSGNVVLAQGSFGSMWTRISEPGFSFGYGTSSEGGKTNFEAQMENSDRLSDVSIYFSRDFSDSNRAWISAYFSGIVGGTPEEMQTQGQSASVNRHGIHYGSSSYLGSYQEVISWPKDDGEPIYGDWISTGSVSFTLFDVIPLPAQMLYDEDERDGQVYYTGSVWWQLEFIPGLPSLPCDGSGSTASAPVPEPASICLLGLAGTILVRRRRNRC